MNNYILTQILFIILLSINCGELTFEEESKNFNPEYDYIDGCDLFPNQNYKYVAYAFDGGNTTFSPYFSEYFATGPILEDVYDIYAFVDDNADCYLDSNLNCVRFDTTLKKLAHGLYLAGVKTWPTAGTLGGTLYDGEQYKAICMIFVDNVTNFANRADVNLDPATLREGAVVHELGHGRADLQHLCLHQNSIDTLNHDDFILCVMTDRFPKPECADKDDKPTLIHGPQFCDSCKINLNNVDWQ